MHDGVQYDLIQGQGQELRALEPYLLTHLQCWLAIDHGFLN